MKKKILIICCILSLLSVLLIGCTDNDNIKVPKMKYPIILGNYKF